MLDVLMLSHVFRSGLFTVAAVSMFVLPSDIAAEVYELRTYTTNEGKLDNLNNRFRDHTIRLFDKHGMESVGYWVPTAEPASQNTLIYVLKHASRDAATASWKAFGNDPEWRKIAKDSQVDGRILAKAPTSLFMTAADYSPVFKSAASDAHTVFELRVYRTHQNKLQNLDARFSDHTISLFNRYRMQSVAYWHPVEKPESSDTLIYIIRHASRDTATASWKAFLADEEWKTVAKQSQLDGTILREPPESTFIKATDYSAIQ